MGVRRRVANRQTETVDGGRDVSVVRTLSSTRASIRSPRPIVSFPSVPPAKRARCRKVFRPHDEPIGTAAGKADGRGKLAGGQAEPPAVRGGSIGRRRIEVEIEAARIEDGALAARGGGFEPASIGK